MAPAPRVLDEDHFAGADPAHLAVARGDLHARVEIDDVLPPRGRMPVEAVVGRHLAEDDSRGGRGPPPPPDLRPVPGGGLPGPQRRAPAAVGREPAGPQLTPFRVSRLA